MISYPVIGNSNTVLNQPTGNGRTSLFEKPEHASDSDKNAGQNSSVPYLAELRRIGNQQEDSAKTAPAEKDPLGRGSVLDFKA